MYMERFFSKILPKTKVASLIELGRPWNGVACSLIALISMFLVASSFPSILVLLSVALVMLFIYVAGTTLNDIYDIGIDAVNMPYRPLGQNKISRKEAIVFSVFLYVLSFLISVFLGLNFFLIVLLYAFCSVIYSFPPISFENRGFLAQLELAFTCAFLPSYAGAVLVLNTFVIPLSVLFTICSLTLLFSFVFIIKDFKDVKGDANGGKNTLALQIGVRRAKAVSVLGTLVFFPLTIFLFNSFFENLFFLVVSIPVFFALIYFEYSSDKKPEKMFAFARLDLLLLFLILLLFSILGRF